MLKKIMFLSLLFLFGVNSTSIIVFGLRLPIFVTLSAVLGIAVGVIGILDVKNKNWHNLKENYLPSGNRFFILFMILWLGYAILSILWQRDYASWRIAVNFLIIGNFCAFTFSYLTKNVKDMFQMYFIMGVIIIAHNLIGWFEVITQIYLFPSSADAIGWMRRPVSLFYNTNNFAIFLVLGVFILYVNYKVQEKIIIKRICVIGILSSVSLILLSRSRGALVAFALGICIFMIIARLDKVKKLVHNLREKRSRFIGSIVLIVFSSSLSFFVVHQVFLTGERAASGIARTNLIRNGFLFLGITNGLGVGAGNVEHWMGNYWGYGTLGMINMHNWWMEILTAYGIPILVLYLVFYVMLAKSTFVKYVKTNDPKEKIVHRVNFSILGAFVVASTIPSSMMPAIWFWAFMGVLIATQKESIYE